MVKEDHEGRFFYRLTRADGLRATVALSATTLYLPEVLADIFRCLGGCETDEETRQHCRDGEPHPRAVDMGLPAPGSRSNDTRMPKDLG